MFYPRVCCPYCGSGELVWEQASGSGRLQSWTLVHRPGHDAFLLDVPYVFAAVTLAEGPLIYGRLLVSREGPSLAIGCAVRVIFSEGAGEAVLPAFAPIR